MAEDELDLKTLDDDELVKQMHDDLYDGLKEEIEEGVRILLDRKDRISMAVGLEVRVPYCDHRLVEYVYNAPWSLKTYDSREKSLLRGAARDVLPQSVVDRVKSPYPSTQDPEYTVKRQHNAREYLSSSGHPVFDIVSRDWLARAVASRRGFGR